MLLDGVALSIVLIIEQGRTFLDFLGVRQFFIFTVSKWEVKQQRQQQLQKRHSKLSVFMLLQSLLRLLHLVHFVKCHDGGVVRLHVKP